jgi:phosphatidylinositol-3-phosphatase
MKSHLSVVSLFFVGAALSQTVPADRHPVVVVMLENHSYSSMYLSPYMPNLAAMTRRYGVAQKFYGNGHYSVGNYMFQTFGRVETINDGYNPDQQGYFSDDNIIRHLLLLGKTYKMYQENIDAAGSTELVSKDGLYVRRHNPLSYTSEFGNMTGPQRALVEVPFTNFSADLSAHQLPDFSFVTPNMINNAHNGSDPVSLQMADTWLQRNIFGPLLADPQFQQTGMLVVSVDESLNTDCQPSTTCPPLPEYTPYCSSNCNRGGGHILTVVIGPNVGPNFKSNTVYMHESTLKSMLRGLGANSFPNGLSAVPTFGVLYQVLTNPGFELSPKNWHSYGSCSVGSLAGVARTGTRYADLIAPGPGTQPICMAADGNGADIYYAVKPGQVVTFSGWGKRVSGDGVARPVIEVSDSRKSNLSWQVTTPNNISSNSWTFTYGSYTVPIGKSFLRFFVEIKGATQKSEVRFDDLALQIR